MHVKNTIPLITRQLHINSQIKSNGWIGRPTFLNFLQVIPEQNGIPFIYLCISDTPEPDNSYDDSLDEYIDNTPLNGLAFTINTAEVNTYI